MVSVYCGSATAETMCMYVLEVALCSLSAEHGAPELLACSTTNVVWLLLELALQAGLAICSLTTQLLAFHPW